ncbi:MAG TPA: ATP-binding protein [Herpetosiphonaceae bacterium]
MSPFLFAFGVLAVFAMQWALRLNTDLIKLSEKQQHVQEAMTSLLVAEDVSQQLNLLLRQLTDVFAIERVRIVLFGINADDEPLIVTSPTAVDLEQICTKTDLLRQLNTEHEMRRIDRDPAYAAYCTMPTFLVPLATSNEVIGAMLFAMPRTALETIESRLLITYTTQAALAVVQSQLIDRIQASQEQLVRSERLAAVGTLAASLAHEFNNILAIISSTAELAAMKPECETHRKSLSLIGMTAKRGGSITRGLLTFTRQIEPYRELANLHDAIEPVLAMLKTRFRDTKVHVVRDFGTVPPLVCDIGLLSQVVLNLVTNALDAMYPTGGTLTIKLWAEDNTIKLRISDTGTGIPDEIRSTLFEPFTTSKQHAEEGILGGNGLGLAITHGIVTSHDGTIDVDSTPGQGTAITVTLPASKSELPESVQVLPVPGLERLRVMVVDDEPLIAMALAQIVEMENHHVTWLSDPELALVHISQAPPDILMADMHMPRLDGLTLIQFAKEFAPAMQQIVVTGQIQAHQRSEVRTLGVEVVHKPFSVADIRAALGRAALALGAGESHAAPVHPGRSEELEIAPTISQQELNPAIRSTVRHQLMNHVTALEGLVPILQQTLYGQPAAPSSLDGPTLLRHMARVVGALGVVVRAQRLLYLSDHDNKPIVLPVAPVTLYHQLIEAKNRVSAGFLPHEQITIEVDCPPDLEIDGNAMSLLTAITAAIYNAAEAIARHASGDEQNITVSAHDQGEIVALRVADTGPGFAPQLLEQIAATIDQGQGEQFIGSLQPRHGTGLGIALMVRVARLHAGTIAFGNHAERRGAWVELLLPKKAMLEAAQLSPSANIVLERVPG